MDQKHAIEKALDHEIRRQILRWHAHRTSPASPKMMSQSLDHPLENLAYHVRVLRKAKLLAETGQTSSRGSIEHFYRLDPETSKLPQVAAILSGTP